MPFWHWNRISVAGASQSPLTLEATFKQTKTLKGAKFFGADMSEAELDGTNLTSANLETAKMDGARLGNATLEFANLTGANLTGAHLRGANLQKAMLAKANFSGAELLGADLRGANFWRADLSNIENGSTAKVRLANLVEVKNSPQDFWDTAMREGAVCMSDEKKWLELRKKETVTPAEITAAQRECDRLGKARSGGSQP